MLHLISTFFSYRECYLRFSSQTYNLRKLHEAIHLTNNSVQSKYKNTGRDVALPAYNMWDCHEFRNYLKNIGYANAFDQIVYPGMKECITGAILLNQEHIDLRQNSFELYGADFMLTENFQPWLIEINAKPALYASTPVTGRMCPQVLTDLIKVIIDVPRKPKADTGKFELLYKENIPRMPKINTATLKLEGTPLNKEYFCESPLATTTTTTSEEDLVTQSRENINEIQEYICKVNEEMHNALKNLLHVIEKERKRQNPKKYGDDEETETTLEICQKEKKSSTEMVKNTNIIHGVMNILKNVVNNTTVYR